MPTAGTCSTAREIGPWTIVLDEAHHLLETWGALVRAIVRHLGPLTCVVGLTATPPDALSEWQRRLQQDLFGGRDFEVPLPALVKDGNLAPYQELVYLCSPTPEEDTWIAAERTRFADLQVQLAGAGLGSIPLFEWLTRRLVERTGPQAQSSATGAGPALSWREFEESAPDLARAGLRFACAGMVAVPPDARPDEAHRVPPDAEDWVAVLADFARHHLAVSPDPRDAAALTAIRQVLPSLGYRLTATGRRAAVSLVDRVVTLSSAKAAAAVHLLDVEYQSRGADLRAVVLCDFEGAAVETPARLGDTRFDPAAGSARLMLSTLAAAAACPAPGDPAPTGARSGAPTPAKVGPGGPSPGGASPGALRPVLVTGTTVAAAADVAADLLRHCRAADPSLPLRLEPLPNDPALRAVVGDGAWSPRVWTRLATAYFASGGAQVLIGTRALLGEGWDCPRVNVSVDVTGAATAGAVVQMRGRSVRLDPAAPGKVASNWTVTCVATGHPRGDSDYLRLVRKHAHLFAPGADGVIEAGVANCDPTLSPYAPPAPDGLTAVTARCLGLAVERDAARERWGIGQPYEGREVPTLRIRSERPLGMRSDTVPAARSAWEPDPARRPRATSRLWLGGAAAGAAAAGSVVAHALDTAAGFGAAGGLVVLAGGLGVRVAGTWRQVATAQPSAALDQLARATADALHDAGVASAGASAVGFATTADGWTAAQLRGVSPTEAGLFARSLDELLGPLADPRHLVGRIILVRPATRRARAALAARATLGLPFDVAISWHAVPTELGRGQRRLTAFLAAWQRWVGPPHHLDARSAEGQAILDLRRGADPFAVTSQLRTQWR